jgi:acyl carrier protein
MTPTLDIVRNAVALVCGVELARLDESTELVELGADSLALVSNADVVESELAAVGRTVSIDDASLGRMRRLGDIVDYVAARGGVLAGA